MTCRMAIVGGGWYGCHIASTLQNLGFEVTLFEQHDRLLHEASGNNQFRLHLGFHYARHYGTRMQSRDGFSRFIERYPGLSREVEENIYAVSRDDSLLDFPTYRLIMTSSGIDFIETDGCSVPMANVDGMLRTRERILLIEEARQYFKRRLDPHLHLGCRIASVEETVEHVIVDGQKYDLLIDATWGHFSHPSINVFYEPTLLLYYETTEKYPAITLVDGPLCSVYPTEDPHMYTLSSVPHTPLGRSDSAHGARIIRDAVDTNLVNARVAAMEEQISKYLPDFRDSFRFLGPQLSMKTKPIGNYDDRSCSVVKNGRVISVMSGKIDTVFFAVERILSLTEAAFEVKTDPVRPVLRDDLARQRLLAPEIALVDALK
jgi:hypothetical protein